MIEMPQRSVTRFFMPMIDVLTLLFCIYLLMPLAKAPPEAESEEEKRAREERYQRLEADLKAKGGVGEQVARNLREEIERLRKEKIETLRNRLAVRVLEIDGATGKLYYRDPERMEIRDQADARAMIERDRKAQGGGKQELYYLVLYPREKVSGYPTVEQRESYDRWFEGVALGYDIPGSAPGKEKP